MTPRLSSRHGPAHDQGVVLIAVLWMVAALSLIVMGLTNATRQETKRTSQARQLVQAKALGDAAIQLALQQIKASPQPLNKLTVADFNYGGHVISVQLQPLNGLIDLNNAPKELLVALFRFGGQQEPSQAEVLANNLIDARSKKDGRGVPLGLESTDDLLSIPGFDYPLYAKIKGLVTADLRGGGKVNVMAAMTDVLAVLAEGNMQKAAQMDTARSAGGSGADTTAINGAFVDTAISLRLNASAKVALADGQVFITSRSVDLLPGDRDGVPWRTFRTAHRIESTVPSN